MIFEKGEYIVCNNVGICLVKDVTPKDMDGVMQEKLYYILQPLDSVNSRIYSAVDNEKMAMRRVISNEEVENLLDEMKEIEILSVDNEKRREEIYKETLHKCECIGWAQLIKTIYCRKKEKASQGKKITTIDSKYLKKAEDYLYHELAISLNLEPIDIKERVLDEIGIEEA